MLSRLLELYRLVRDITRAGLTEQGKSSVEWTYQCSTESREVFYSISSVSARSNNIMMQ
jgi:hypothetical protein